MPRQAAGLVSRADLLAAWATAAPGDDAARARVADLLGFTPRPPAPPQQPDSGRATPAPAPHVPEPQPAPAEGTAAALQAQLPMATSWEAAAATDGTPAPPPGEPGTAAPMPPLQPYDPGLQLPWSPLVRPARLWPALAHSLQQPRDAGIDLTALLRQLARGQPAQRLTRRQRGLWSGQQWVVIDKAPHLQPFAADMAGVVSALARLRGPAGLVLWCVAGSPDLPQGPPASGPHRTQAVRGRWPTPPPGTSVLLLSDLAALRTDAAAPAAARQWRDFVQHLHRSGAMPLAWVPMAPRQVQRDWARALAMHCLQPGAGLRRQSGQPGAGTEELARLQALLPMLHAMLACCVHLDPLLLRALRLAHPALRHEPALEALYWQQGGTPDGAASASRASRVLQPAVSAQVRAGLAALPADALDPAVRLAIGELLLRRHAGQPRALLTEELSLWHVHAAPKAAGPAWPPALVRAAAEAERWLHALGDHAAALPADGPAAERLAQYGSHLLARHRDDAAWQQRLAPALARLWALAPTPDAPVHLPAATLQQALQQRQPLPVRRYTIVQYRGGLWLWPAETLPPRASPIAFDWPAARVVLDRPGAGRSVLQPDGQPCLLPEANGPLLPAVLHGDGVSIGLECQRPPWASSWGRDRSGLFADLTVYQVVQRLRWLPPGEFWMGSPDDEPGHHHGEGRRGVRLTMGLWLADSACTQALWQAVMGSNPAHFQGDLQRPVEQVSFDDVQLFLQQLREQLPPGCLPGLPTEAEWEYACRAGTDTAFHFGPAIDRNLVNFNAAHDTPLAQRGEESKSTVPVKSLPPNAWGLHEMHGNVWEWCDDYSRVFPPQRPIGIAENPLGSREQGPDAPRAMRGGSWFHGAVAARSALRGAERRADRGHYLGFRLALRSTIQEAPDGVDMPSAPEAPAVAAPQAVADPASPAGRRNRKGLTDEERWLFGSDAPTTPPQLPKHKP